MSYFYTKDGEIFVPEKINPALVKICNAVVKTCKLTFKLQMKTTAINNAIKGGKTEKMLEIMQKCMEKYKNLYNDDMALTGVIIDDIDSAYFEDKDVEFFKSQLQILSDFAVINTVIESRMMALVSAGCEKALGTPLNKIKFFTNQDVILEEVEDEEEAE